MVIYADEMFFINFIFNYLALFILGKSMKLCIKKIRLLAAAAAGALCAVALFCLNTDLMIVKAGLAFIMIICAYGWNGRYIIYRFGVFLIILAAISGTVILLISLSPNAVNSVIKNGIIYFNISGKRFFVIFILSYPVVSLLYKGLKEWRNRKLYTTMIQRGNRTITVKALFDSGNKLKEPITGKPVMIAEWNTVKNLFENPVEFEALIEKAEEYKLWIIPYHALGNMNGRILAFLADRILVDEKVIERVFVGITEQKISGEYNALLNADLL